VCIDADNHPLYVHCLDGRRITSLLVVLLRRLQGWLPLSAISEYWRYQSQSRLPTVGLIEVEKHAREVENFASELSEVVIPERIPQWLWSGNRNVKVPGAKLKFVPPLHCADSSLLSAGSLGAPVASRSGTGAEPSEAQKDALFEHSPTEEERPREDSSQGIPVAVSRAISALDLHGLGGKKKSSSSL